MRGIVPAQLSVYEMLKKEIDRKQEKFHEDYFKKWQIPIVACGPINETKCESLGESRGEAIGESRWESLGFSVSGGSHETRI